MKMLTLEERGWQIQAKLDAGTRVPSREEMMNSGRCRTRSKRELLAALQRVERDDGRAVAFEAKF
jgi:hypothetical protein